MADDEYHEEERKMIHDLCMKYSISQEQLDNIISDVLTDSLFLGGGGDWGRESEWRLDEH